MFWGKKKEPVPAPQPVKPEAPPDQLVSEMLAAYQHHFYEQEKGKPDSAVDEAKAKIARAQRIISDSRIGYSMTALVDHVMHWPTWSKRDDFEKWTAFAVSNVGGRKDKDEKENDRTIVQFDYSGARYTLVFVDEGMDRWGNDYTHRYGTVELYAGQDLVCGLDLSCDTSRGIEYEQWRFTQVFAFAPGDWMKHIVEMGAHIDAHRTRQRDSILNADTLKRGDRIKF